jgi:hypothetical protein
MVTKTALALFTSALGVAAAQAQCPGGQCRPGFGVTLSGPLGGSVQFGAVAPRPVQRLAATFAPPKSALGATPVGTAPGPNFAWAHLDGVGYGWVEKSLLGKTK